ncbi:MAG: PEGA domain-containing protein [Acidobacteriota bacterium]
MDRFQILRLTLVVVLFPALAFAKDHYFGNSSGTWGKLKTKVKPADASVWIDDQYVGHADRFDGPGQELFLTPGEYDVTFSLAYYQNFKTRVKIEPDGVTVIQQQLQPSDEQRPTGPFGVVKIKSTPEHKVGVFVNGRFIGHADEMNGPAQELLLQPGTHKIELKYAGYQPYETTVTAEANTRQVIEVTLQPDPSTVYVDR